MKTGMPFGIVRAHQRAVVLGQIERAEQAQLLAMPTGRPPTVSLPQTRAGWHSGSSHFSRARQPGAADPVRQADRGVGHLVGDDRGGARPPSGHRPARRPRQMATAPIPAARQSLQAARIAACVQRRDGRAVEFTPPSTSAAPPSTIARSRVGPVDHRRQGARGPAAQTQDARPCADAAPRPRHSGNAWCRS